jgi:hypothetical protein
MQSVKSSSSNKIVSAKVDVYFKWKPVPNVQKSHQCRNVIW